MPAALSGLAQRFPGGPKGAAVAGVAGVAGLAYVLSHRGSAKGSRSSRAAGGTAPAAETETPYAVAATYPNTYATDVASAVGDVDARLQANLAAWQKQTGSTTDALKAAQARQSKTLSEVSKQVAALRKVGTPAKPSKPAKTAPKKAPGKTRSYTIRPGDTLSSIAHRYGTSVSALAKTNRISNPNLIRAGAKITIPA